MLSVSTSPGIQTSAMFQKYCPHLLPCGAVFRRNSFILYLEEYAPDCFPARKQMERESSKAWCRAPVRGSKSCDRCGGGTVMTADKSKKAMWLSPCGFSQSVRQSRLRASPCPKRLRVRNRVYPCPESVQNRSGSVDLKTRCLLQRRCMAPRGERYHSVCEYLGNSHTLIRASRAVGALHGQAPSEDRAKAVGIRWRIQGEETRHDFTSAHPPPEKKLGPPPRLWWSRPVN